MADNDTPEIRKSMAEETFLLPESTMPFYQCLFQQFQAHMFNVKANNKTNNDSMLTPHCNDTWNGLSCWPRTEELSTATLPCPSVVNGKPYDVSINATRDCFKGGVWAEWSNYSLCRPVGWFGDDIVESLTGVSDDVVLDMSPVTRAVIIIYFIGYSISLAALAIALLVFSMCSSLRCTRNNIHCNLMASFAITTVCWFSNHYLIRNYVLYPGICKFSVATFTYITVTSFFWMLIEGFHLYMMVVKVYNVRKYKMIHYLLFGWGVPALFILAWAIVKHHFDNTECWMPNEKTFYDYITIVPILIVLLVNTVFLINIMWVTVSQIEVHPTCNGKKAESLQFRKGAKGFVLLMPLLGTTYILVLMQPDHLSPLHDAFRVATALLVSSQGFFVSMFYCFRNGEVQAAISRTLRKMMTSQSRHYSKSSMSTTAGGDGVTRGRGMMSQCGSVPKSPGWVGRLSAGEGDEDVFEIVAGKAKVNITV